LRIDLFQQASEGSLRRYLILPGSAPARAAAQATPLAMIEALSKLGNGVRAFATRRHRQSDEGQETSQLVAHSSGIARIGHVLMKTFPQRVQSSCGYRTGRRQRTLRVGQSGCQLRCPDLLQGSLSQGSYPELLGMFSVGVKVLPVSLVALGRPQRLPACRFVTGATKTQRINEGFHHQHRITKVLPPILSQALTNQLQNPRRQIRPLTWSGQHQKPGVLRDQMPPFLDLARRPVQPLVPELDVKSG